MKNLFLTLAFTLIGTFAFANNSNPIDSFPKYEKSMLISELDCSADCTLSSCSGTGNCTCSCSWFKCNCTTNPKEIEPLGLVSMNKEQYEKTKLLALILSSINENESYTLISNMVGNLKEKKYNDFQMNRDLLVHNMKNLPSEKKEVINSFFKSINAKERV